MIKIWSKYLRGNMRFIYMIILLSHFYASGVFSNGIEKSLNFSISYTSDNDNLYAENENNEIFIIEELKPKVYNAMLNMVFKGKYEIGYNFLYNSSFVNAYNLPERGSYNYLYFSYHLKERKRIPINLLFNVKYGYRKSTLSNDKLIYNSILFLVKLIVNTEENTIMRDVIWFGPKIDIAENDQFFGFDLGIYHPIK